MAERILFPEWRKANEPTKYPFSSRATLTNLDGTTIIEGTFLDAALYPIGAGNGLHLAQVDINHEQVLLIIKDEHNNLAATGKLPLVNAPDDILLTDSYGRPAGIIVSESERLGIFQSWGVGAHVFTGAMTEFCATVCFPTPEIGVRGIMLDDGSIFTGDVWLVGDDGVVFRPEQVTLPATCGKEARTVKVIRMDVVGDPLFRRRLCQPNDLFATPRLVKAVRVIGSNGEFTCGPDAHGDIKLAVGNDLAQDTILRVTTAAEGLTVSTVGSAQQSTWNA